MVSDRELKEIWLECARKVLEICYAKKAGHLGSSLSCLDILVDLYFRRMKPEDRCLLSKGHAAAALYVVLARSGRIPAESLSSFFVDGTSLGCHPPWSGQFDEIPFGTGSLGHGLSLAAGLALSQRFSGKKSEIYCVLSDGDCNEGSTWEAALFASQHRLSELTVVIDQNGLQGLGSTSDILNLEPLEAKWRDFGFETVTVRNGHDYVELDEAHASLRKRSQNRPRCLIARTVKGSGVSFMENRFEWHYPALTEAQFRAALDELKNRSPHAS